jgi:cytochrome c
MRPKLATLIALAATLAAVAQTSHSVGDGVYTQAQANRGKTTYTEQCASCHGAELRGTDETPGLTGDTFLANWRSHSVDDFFEKVQVSMPADKPGSLSRQKNADVLAYIFAANKFPAGNTELSAQADALKEIRFQPGAAPATAGPPRRAPHA